LICTDPAAFFEALAWYDSVRMLWNRAPTLPSRSGIDGVAVPGLFLERVHARVG